MSQLLWFLPIGILLGGWYYWKSRTTKPRYLLFLDVDGTLTSQPGADPQSLFAQWIGLQRHNIWDNRLSLFAGSEESLNKVRSFLQELCKIAEDEVTIVLLTANYQEPVQYLWETIFDCPWSRISKSSVFRSSIPNKIAQIDKYISDAGIGSDTKILYLEDDPIVGKHSLPKTVKWIDCSSGQWIYHKIQAEISALENLEQIH